MKNTHEESDAEYHRLIQDPIPGPLVPFKPLRSEVHSRNGKHTVAIVRSDDRREGIREAYRLMGGLGKMTDGVQGEIIIKPNCNTDDAFPRNSHHETVRVIAEELIETGYPADKICVGDMSGRYRGLPTRNTIEEMGIKAVADDLGIQVGYFEEEEWVTVKPPGSISWPDGIKIPRRIHEAGRVILTPVMRPHRSPIFTIALKLCVGLIDPVGREWLHWNKNQDLMNRMIDINLAFSTDLVVTDAQKFFIDKGPAHNVMAEPGLTIVGSNRVAADAVAVCIMKQHNSHRMEDTPVREHTSFTLGEDRGLGSSSIEDIELLSSNLEEDILFGDVVSQVREELSYQR
ncbi:MAG: DUF362 domain-containing protein [Candidatus Bathyarchaeota archaeon]|jgi:uncharacterized protein (DUF362 family)|nr:DUF362 domain-containing protein [Candidatus Bathyarchaeota archaeon]